MCPPAQGPESPQYQNRRRVFRLEAPLVAPRPKVGTVDPYRMPIPVELVTKEGVHCGRLLDLSLGGMAILLRAPLDPMPSGLLQLQFELPGIESPLRLPVLPHHGGLAPGGFRLGLEIKISDSAKATQVDQALSRYLTERQQRDLRNRAG